jgi:CBS domain-containing protein
MALLTRDRGVILDPDVDFLVGVGSALTTMVGIVADLDVDILGPGMRLGVRARLGARLGVGFFDGNRNVIAVLLPLVIPWTSQSRVGQEQNGQQDEPSGDELETSHD